MTRTLADMTPAERDDCVGRWAAQDNGFMVVIVGVDEDASDAYCIAPRAGHYGWADWADWEKITPIFDMPRAWTPSGEPVPGEWVESPSDEHIHRWCARWERKPDEVTP